MKLASLISPFCAAAVLLSLPTSALPESRKAGKDDLPEVNVVLRISRKLVNELTTKKVQRTTPVYLCVLDSEITGLAYTDALSTVQFETKAEATDFVVELRGTVVSHTVAERPPIKVFGSGYMEFLMRKRVTFDGVKFRTQPTNFDAAFRTSVDGIATPPGLIGLIIEVIALPQVRSSQPIVARAAYEDGRAELIVEFDKEVNRVIDDLNQVSPLEETVQKLFPQTKDWIYYPSTTPTQLIVGVGPRNHRVPELPATGKPHAPVELWIRSKPETQGMIQVLKLWKNAGQQLDKLLPGALGKKLSLEDGFSTQTVKDWFVIRLGPQVKDNQEETSGGSSMIVWRAIGTSGGARGAKVGPTPVRPLFAQDRGGESGTAADATMWRKAGGSTQ